MQVKVVENYGPLKKGRVHSVLNKGRDWISVSCKGKPFFAPSWVFSFHIELQVPIPPEIYTKSEGLLG